MISKFLERRRKNKAIKNYIRKLPSYLEKQYGKSRHYSEEQVKSALEKHNISSKYDSYAYSLYVSPKEVEGILIRLGESKSGKELRQVMVSAFIGYSISPFGSVFGSDAATGDSGGGDSGGGGGGD